MFVGDSFVDGEIRMEWKKRWENADGGSLECG